MNLCLVRIGKIKNHFKSQTQLILNLFRCGSIEFISQNFMAEISFPNYQYISEE